MKDRDKLKESLRADIVKIQALIEQLDQLSALSETVVTQSTDADRWQQTIEASNPMFEKLNGIKAKIVPDIAQIIEQGQQIIKLLYAFPERPEDLIDSVQEAQASAMTVAHQLQMLFFVQTTFLTRWAEELIEQGKQQRKENP